MPGFNGTGPLGTGPMTGGGRGYCLSIVTPGSAINPGLGRGGGYRRRNRYCAAGIPGWGRRRAQGTFAPGWTYVPPESGQQELNLLREQVNNLEAALEQAGKRISELESKK